MIDHGANYLQAEHSMIDHGLAMIDHGIPMIDHASYHDRSWPGGDSHQLLLLALFRGFWLLDIFPCLFY
ncbi:hypothetical protein LguiB_027585 [Lonicera macranthoides]